MKTDEQTKVVDSENNKRKAIKTPNQLIINLFNKGRRYYLLVVNSVGKDETRMFYLLDDKLAIVCSHKVENQQINQSVISVSTNEDFTKILVNCSDRVMRLYLIDYSAGANAIKLIDGFLDVINHKRWLNVNFIQLPERTKIFIPQSYQEGQTLTTESLNNLDRFANSSRELFVGSIGEHIADTLKFFNVPDSQLASAVNYREIQKTDLQKKGCLNMSAFSGAHFSIMMVSSNGSLYIWVPRPAKFVQPLSPNFTEIEENLLYVEKEDEFEHQQSSDEETPEEAIGGLGLSLLSTNDGQNYENLLKPLTKK
jgi:hypothetical protein